MNNYINREQYLEVFLENVFCISDENYQTRIWVRNEGPESDDIDDSISDFFDDGDTILEKYKDYKITENQYKLLLKLRNKLDDFIEKFSVFYPQKSTKELIQKSEWQEIRKIAKQVLEAFEYKKNK